MFATNVGSLDRILRVVLGLTLLSLIVLFPDASWRWFGLVGLVPLITAAIASCPVYSLIGISTCPMKRA